MNTYYGEQHNYYLFLVGTKFQAGIPLGLSKGVVHVNGICAGQMDRGQS